MFMQPMSDPRKFASKCFLPTGQENFFSSDQFKMTFEQVYDTGSKAEDDLFYRLFIPKLRC